jgi:multimeric flavodoxin WrbA
MSKNIVVLTGSPRKKSSSARLAVAFIEGDEAGGHSVTLFRVAGMKIGGCLGCDHCIKEKGVCVQKDDMQQISSALRSADILVLASPVYFWGITSQLKQAIDRMYALLQRRTKIKQAVLLMSCGDDSDSVANPSIAMFREICSYMKWKEAGIIIAPGLNTADEIEGRPELEQANKLGREI